MKAAPTNAASIDAVSVQAVEDGAAWNEALARLPGRHVLQSWEWGQVVRSVGALDYVYNKPFYWLYQRAVALRR